MKGTESLKACRSALEEIQRLNMLLEDLRDAGRRVDLDSRIQEAEKELKAARLAYTRALSGSVEAMAGMPDAPRAVLWQAFVLGKSNSQVAECLHFARRSVVRLKKTGMEWLEAREPVG